MRKPIRMTILLAAMVGISSLAFAGSGDPPVADQGGPPARGMHARHRWMGDRGYARLDLTDAQRSQIRELTRGSFDQAKPLMEALKQKRQAFESAEPGSPGYLAAASDLAQAEADAARARVTREADLRAKIYGILTQAQRAQLADLRARHQARIQQWKAFQAEHPISGSSAPTE
jgi:periplasmic protein CpxP/Spy